MCQIFIIGRLFRVFVVFFIAQCSINNFKEANYTIRTGRMALNKVNEKGQELISHQFPFSHSAAKEIQSVCTLIIDGS